MIQLEAHQDRIHLRLTALSMGRDLCVTLSGGDREHIGAVALAHAGNENAAVLAVPRHREADLARNIASRLAAHLQSTVCVACGIHLEGITPAEITEVLELSETLTLQLMERLEN